MRFITSSMYIVAIFFLPFIGKSQDFITQWTFSSAATQIRFNALTVGAVTYTWSASPSGNSGSGSFTAASPVGVTLTGLNIPANNTVTLSMSPGNLRRFFISYGPDRNILTNVAQWGGVPWSSMASMFDGCENLNISATDVPDLSDVTDMSYMFDNATSFNSPIGNWNTSAVTKMNRMFLNASAFNQPIGNWNTSAVTNMNRMFFNASAFNQPIGNWNISAVTTMSEMFYLASAFNQPIGNWNTSAVTTMSEMFYGASAFNQNLGGWILNPNLDLQAMFDYSGMDCDRYSATLVGWQSNNPTVTGRTLGADGRQYGTSATAARNTLTSTQGWTITGDSPSGTACSALLPIGLLSFAATHDGTNVMLQWQTSSEINNHYFEIGHSQNGLDFKSIGRKEGAGDSNTILDYHFEHKDVDAGIHYYRLKQVDYDGQYSYSDIVSVFVKREGNDVSIYPNPATNIIFINGADGLYYTIYDLVGRQVIDGQISDDAISIDHLSTGMYYLHLDSKAGQSVYKIWKE